MLEERWGLMIRAGAGAYQCQHYTVSVTLIPSRCCVRAGHAPNGAIGDSYVRIGERLFQPAVRPPDETICVVIKSVVVDRWGGWEAASVALPCSLLACEPARSSCCIRQRSCVPRLDQACALTV